MLYMRKSIQKHCLTFSICCYDNVHMPINVKKCRCSTQFCDLATTCRRHADSGRDYDETLLKVFYAAAPGKWKMNRKTMGYEYKCKFYVPAETTIIVRHQQEDREEPIPDEKPLRNRVGPFGR